MESLGQTYNRNLFEYALNQSEKKLAIIADEKSYIDNLPQGKYTVEHTGLVLRRFKIRILSEHDEGTPVENLPWAYGQSPNSGLRGESIGVPVYPPNSYVDVVQDPDTGLYYILGAHCNTVSILENQQRDGEPPASGYIPGSSLFPVAQTHINPDKTGRADGGEICNISIPSLEDEKQSKLGEEPIPLPSKCRNINTDGINYEITKLIKSVQDLKTGLVGEDSFLQTSQDFINEVQSKVNATSAKVAQWMSWLIQEIRKFVMRKVNGIVNSLTGNAPLSSRYLVNEAKNKSLSIISCLFVKLLQNLEALIAQALNALIDKIINTAECLIENFLGDFIGQLLSQLTGAINGALGALSSLLGTIISITTDILDFVISILDFLTCKVENVCPVTDKWNFLEGGQPSNFSIDFNDIFNKAKGYVENFNGVIDLPDNLGDFDFVYDINAGDILNECGINPETCGVPNVVFWGGNGSGASGNVVVNAIGDIIGVDIITPGNYSDAPFVNFEDNCGNGTGATGIAVIDTVEVYTDDGTIVPTDETGTGTTDVTGTGDGTGTTDVIGTGDGTGTTGTTDGTGTGGRETTTVTGVTNVVITDPGYGYLPKPDGSKGGMNRTWADRCQTIVRRANGDWDPPYSEGQLIKLFFGDMIQLPGEGEVHIDCDFTADKLPGCSITGTLTCLKSMSGFDDGKGGTFGELPNIKSMVGFDDIRGSSPAVTPPIPPEHQKRLEVLLKNEEALKALRDEQDEYQRLFPGRTGRPDQFGYVNDYPYARELGFTDQDIRFYIEGFYSKLLGKRVGPLMQLKLNDPNFGPLPKYITGQGGAGVFDCENDYPYAVSLGFTDQDIRYYLENFYTGTISECMQKKLNDPNWGRIPEFYVTLTAPGCPPEDQNDGNNYEVISEIEDVIVEDGGFGYQDTDTVTVFDCSGNRDVAAEVQLTIQNGVVIGARVISPGSGYSCIPEMQINTDTGYNAVLKPVLRFSRPRVVPPGTEVISVIDCVGKF